MFDNDKFSKSCHITLDSMYESHQIEKIWSWLFENGIIVHFSLGGDENLYTIDHIDKDEVLMKECSEFINSNQGKYKIPLFWILKYEYGSPVGIIECGIDDNKGSSSKL